MSNFILIGGAGYVARKHVDAIQSVNADLLAVIDPAQGVGYLDQCFPRAKYFRHTHQADAWIRSARPKINYVVVCSPNHLHFRHTVWGMMQGADVILEKPPVINPDQVPVLIKLEEVFGVKVYPVLQLRYLPQVRDLIDKIGAKWLFPLRNPEYEVEYHAPRGDWYQGTWKMNPVESGGLAYNIGIHVFDILCQLFGPCKVWEESRSDPGRIEGDAVHDFGYGHIALTIDLAECATRRIRIHGVGEIDLSQGFTEGHRRVYKEIQEGNGLSLLDTLRAVEMCGLVC